MQRAVFLDRDGVINRAIVRDRKPYPPCSLSELEILPGVPDALRGLKTAGYRLVVVTNQPDVARGTTPKATVDEINRSLQSTLPIDDVLVCFHDGKDACDCRKPKPGLLFTARDAYGIDMAQSFMIGDRWRDIEAGLSAGCRAIWIDYGYDEQSPPRSPNHVCRSLADAATWILQTQLREAEPCRLTS